MASEKSPLLDPEQQSNNLPNYSHSGEGGDNDATPASPNQFVSVPPVGLDELPPPYSASGFGGNLVISCKVCNHMIDISGKRDQHVVKCSNCNEATPVRTAPPGKKYVRCPCNCLLICKSNSERIACPRNYCKRIITLTPNPATPTTPTIPGMCQVSCAHCHNLFLFNSLNNSLSRCPHCRKVSSVGHHFARHRGRIYLVLAIICLVMTISMIVSTIQLSKRHGGLYVGFIGLPILTLVLFARSIYFFTIKVSVIEGPP